MSPIIVSFSIAIWFLLIIVRVHTTHVVCEHDALTLRFAETLGGGEMLQVEHRGEGGAEVLRRMLLYHHHHNIFFYTECEVVLCTWSMLGALMKCTKF